MSDHRSAVTTFSSLTLAFYSPLNLLACFLIRLLEKVGEVHESRMTELELAIDHIRSFDFYMKFLLSYLLLALLSLPPES